MGQVRRGRRLRPAPPPPFRQPQPRRPEALPAGHADGELDPPVRRRRRGRPYQDRSAVYRPERPVLAGPWASRHHELPPRGDVRRGGGLDDRSRRNPVHLSDRRTSPWVTHDRRTINPLCAPRRLRRVGTALDRRTRLPPAICPPEGSRPEPALARPSRLVDEQAFPGSLRRDYRTWLSEGPNADRTRRVSRSMATCLVESTSTSGRPPATGPPSRRPHLAEVSWSSKCPTCLGRHVRDSGARP